MKTQDGTVRVQFSPDEVEAADEIIEQLQEPDEIISRGTDARWQPMPTIDDAERFCSLMQHAGEQQGTTIYTGVTGEGPYLVLISKEPIPPDWQALNR